MRVSLSQRFVYQSWFKLLVLSYSLSWNSETLSALCDWWPFRMECVKNKWKAGAELWVPSSGKLMHATFNWWLIIIFALVWYFILISFTFNPWSMIYDTYLAAAIDCSSFDPIVRLAIFLVEKDSAIKKWGHRQFWGTHFLRHRNLRGRNGGTPPKIFQNFGLEIFLRSI